MQNHVPSSTREPPATEVGPNLVAATPTCPICKSGMRFVQATPIIFSPGLVEVSYVCDECGQATKRTLKRT